MSNRQNGTVYSNFISPEKEHFLMRSWTFTYDLSYELILFGVKISCHVRFLRQRSFCSKVIFLTHTYRHTYTPCSRSRPIALLGRWSANVILYTVSKRSLGWINYDNYVHITQPKRRHVTWPDAWWSSPLTDETSQLGICLDFAHWSCNMNVIIILHTVESKKQYTWLLGSCYAYFRVFNVLCFAVS